MKGREYLTYDYSFRDGVEIAPFISGATKVNSLNEIVDNTYFMTNVNEVIFQSDGTSRVGLLFNLTGSVRRQDFVVANADLRLYTGGMPSIHFEEFSDTASTVINQKQLEKNSGYEFLKMETICTDRYGLARGRVFIGLEAGKSGRFSVRYPLIRHFAQQKYSETQLTRKFKTLQVSKTSGTWATDTTTSYRLLDSANITFPTAQTMVIRLNTPFVNDIPQIFVMENDTFKGRRICYGYRTKEEIHLYVYDLSGNRVSWSAIEDGAQFQLRLEAGVYY